MCIWNQSPYVFISSVCYFQTCIYKYPDVYPPLYVCILYILWCLCIFTPICMYILCMYIQYPPWPVKVLRLTDCLNSEWWRTIISTTISFRFTIFSTQSFRFVTSELICYERCVCWGGGVYAFLLPSFLLLSGAIFYITERDLTSSNLKISFLVPRF